MKIENWKIKWKLKIGNFQFNFKQKLIVIWMNVKYADGKRIHGSKGTFDFCFKTKLNFEFFSVSVFIIKSKNNFQIRISIFNKIWKLNFMFIFFFRDFFFAWVLIWSVMSPKLPLKNESFHLFLMFFKTEYKSQTLIFVVVEFWNLKAIFEFCFFF